MTAAVTSLPLSKYTGGKWRHSCLLWPTCLFTIHMRDCPSPPLHWSFHITAAVTSFQLHKVAGRVLPLLPSLATLFIYSSPEGLLIPHSLELGVPSPPCYVFFIFFQLLVYYSVCFILFVFSPLKWGSVCPGGYAYLAQGCLWEYRMLLS
jgi:hypothetical protein